MDTFRIGDHVEIKGFGQWRGTTLLGDVVDYLEGEFYIVNLWPIFDPDESGDFENGTGGDAYYFGNHDEYHVIHRRFVREPMKEQPGQEYNVGDIIDWNNNIFDFSNICTIQKGTVIGKRFRMDEYLTDPDEQWTYDIQLDGSNDVVQDYNYRMRPHQPWL